MSATLIIAVPLALLGIVALLGFIGCTLPVGGLPPSFTKYSDQTVLGNKNCVAYWPLGEANDLQPAVDRVAMNNGAYKDMTTAPQFYPWLEYTINNSPNPDVLSPEGLGTIQFGQSGIVDGDFLAPNFTTQAPCIVVNGALVIVDIPNKGAINPSSSFTLEAWVRVDWKAGDTHGSRGIIDSRDNNPKTGFALLAEPDAGTTDTYHWQAVVGDGTQFNALVGGDPPITLNDGESSAVFYLAVTFDATMQLLTLFVNGQESAKMSTGYVPNTTQALFIGAMAPFLPPRNQVPSGTPSSPLFPWNGALQDVAIYNVALDGNTILLHFHNGEGKTS